MAEIQYNFKFQNRLYDQNINEIQSKFEPFLSSSQQQNIQIYLKLDLSIESPTAQNINQYIQQKQKLFFKELFNKKQQTCLRKIEINLKRINHSPLPQENIKFIIDIQQQYSHNQNSEEQYQKTIDGHLQMNNIYINHIKSEDILYHVYKDMKDTMYEQYGQFSFQHFNYQITNSSQILPENLNNVRSFDDIIEDYTTQFSVTNAILISIDFKEELLKKVIPLERSEYWEKFDQLLQSSKFLVFILPNSFLCQYPSILSTLAQKKDHLKQIIIVEKSLPGLAMGQSFQDDKRLEQIEYWNILELKKIFYENQNAQQSLYFQLLGKFNSEFLNYNNFNSYNQLNISADIQIYFTQSMHQYQSQKYLELVQAFHPNRLIESMQIDSNLNCLKNEILKRDFYNLQRLTLNINNIEEEHKKTIYKIATLSSLTHLKISEKINQNQNESSQLKSTLQILSKAYQENEQSLSNLVSFEFIHISQDQICVALILSCLIPLLQQYQQHFDVRFIQRISLQNFKKYFKLKKEKQPEDDDNDSDDQGNWYKKYMLEQKQEQHESKDQVNPYHFEKDNDIYTLFFLPIEIQCTEISSQVFFEFIKQWEDRMGDTYLRWKNLTISLYRDSDPNSPNKANQNLPELKQQLKSLTRFFNPCLYRNIVFKNLNLKFHNKFWDNNYKPLMKVIIQLYSVYQILYLNIFFDDKVNFLKNNYIKLSLKTLKIKLNNLFVKQSCQKYALIQYICQPSLNLNERIENLKVKVIDRYRTCLDHSDPAYIHKTKLLLSKALGKLLHIKNSIISFQVWYRLNGEDDDTSLAEQLEQNNVFNDFKVARYQKYYNLNCVKILQQKQAFIRQTPTFLSRLFNEYQNQQQNEIQNLFENNVIKDILDVCLNVPAEGCIKKQKNDFEEEILSESGLTYREFLSGFDEEEVEESKNLVEFNQLYSSDEEEQRYFEENDLNSVNEDSSYDQKDMDQMSFLTFKDFDEEDGYFIRRRHKNNRGIDREYSVNECSNNTSLLGQFSDPNVSIQTNQISDYNNPDQDFPIQNDLYFQEYNDDNQQNNFNNNNDNINGNDNDNEMNDRLREGVEFAIDCKNSLNTLQAFQGMLNDQKNCSQNGCSDISHQSLTEDCNVQNNLNADHTYSDPKYIKEDQPYSGVQIQKINSEDKLNEKEEDEDKDQKDASIKIDVDNIGSSCNGQQE